MNPFVAAVIAALAFLKDAAPEIRERCTETTYQKLQGLIVQLEPVAAELESVATATAGIPHGLPDDGFGQLFPGGPDLAEIVPRLFAMFEKQEAAADAREKVTADLVKSMEKIAALMFDTGTPAA